MKRFWYALLLVSGAFFMVSWGDVGHKAIAIIAGNHLTPTAQQQVKYLLGRESLADVSTWADEIRAEPQNKYTAEWHFVNIEPGLTFSQFADRIKNMKNDNAYKAILYYFGQLTNPKTSKSEKKTALKYLVHFVGDIHQPMHVSRSEDRGGNSISVTFFDYNKNLHGLWDYAMIEHEGLSLTNVAESYDTATPAQIVKWQSDAVMIWAWESYQISTILYQEAAENANFSDDYYQSHIGIIHNRIDKAGIRLAGLLNAAFSLQGSK